MTKTNHIRMSAVLVALVLATAAVVLALVANPAWAATTITVTNDDDSGPASLRQAIADAVSGDTIDFNLADCPCTITLTSGELVIDKNLTIQGPGADQLAVSGNNASRVFYNGGVTTTISGLTVTGGNGGGRGGSFGGGGGILNDGGTLTVSDSTLFGNSGNLGGGIHNRGGGTLTVSDSTLSGNNSANFGGGILHNSGTLTVSDSTFSGNSANQGGGIFIFNQGTGMVSNSTLSGNTAPSGGGINNNNGGTLTVSNSTLSGNNSAPSGGGGIINFATATLENTIVANSPSGGNCASGIIDGGYNISSDVSCAFAAEGSRNATDPMLGALADNGGPTLTHALLAGSPAIDKGKSFGFTTDQRGVERPQDDPAIQNAPGGDGSDIGAFELEYVSPPDTTAPTVASVTPTKTTGVSRTPNITATFSEQMDKATVEAIDPTTQQSVNVKLFTSGNQVAATVSCDADPCNKVTITPENALKANTKYKAIVSTRVEDLAGNRLDQDPTTTGNQRKAWTFTTKK